MYDITNLSLKLAENICQRKCRNICQNRYCRTFQMIQKICQNRCYIRIQYVTRNGGENVNNTSRCLRHVGDQVKWSCPTKDFAKKLQQHYRDVTGMMKLDWGNYPKIALFQGNYEHYPDIWGTKFSQFDIQWLKTRQLWRIWRMLKHWTMKVWFSDGISVRNIFELLGNSCFPGHSAHHGLDGLCTLAGAFQSDDFECETLGMWRFYDGTWWDSECDFSDQLWCHLSFLTIDF